MRLTLSLLPLTVMLGWLTGPAPSLDARADEALARAAAVAWLDTLDEADAAQALFPLADEERRSWSNLPHTMFPRQGGLSFGEMSDLQRRTAHALLRAVLSSAGYLRVTGIMRGDDILAALSAERAPGAPPAYGHGYYWLALFGDPRGTGPWGLQLDGHHLALNITAADGVLEVTPSFFGGNPIEVASGPYAGWRLLDEFDTGARRFLASLSEDQRQAAVLAADSPGDILAGPGKATRSGAPQGLAWKELDAAQQLALRALVQDYVGSYPASVARRALADFVRDTEGDLRFAWWGGSGTERPYAYRIHGERTWIELAQMRGAGSEELGMNHIHAIWRRPGGDFGADLLAKPADASR